MDALGPRNKSPPKFVHKPPCVCLPHLLHEILHFSKCYPTLGQKPGAPVNRGPRAPAVEPVSLGSVQSGQALRVN